MYAPKAFLNQSLGFCVRLSVFLIQKYKLADERQPRKRKPKKAHNVLLHQLVGCVREPLKHLSRIAKSFIHSTILHSTIMSTKCEGCQEEFVTRNAVFRHLKETCGVCLPPTAYADYCEFAKNQKHRDKVIILYGYIIDDNSNGDAILKNGQDAAELLLEVVEDPSDSDKNIDNDASKEKAFGSSKVNRSYGNVSRNTTIAQQDDGTGALTEVIACKLPPLLTMSVDTWIENMNQALTDKIQQLALEKTGTNKTTTAQIRVFGRQTMPLKRFNAETDVSHRRIEYLLPLDFLFPDNGQPDEKEKRREFFETMHSFSDGLHSRNKSNSDNTSSSTDGAKPSDETLKYLIALKKKMQSLTTHIVKLDVNDKGAVLEKSFHNKKRNRSSYQQVKNRDESRKDHVDAKEAETAEETDEQERKRRERKEKSEIKKEKEANKVKHVLQRKRYHNFTLTVMAHEFLSYRRLDRLYHRSTSRFDEKDDGTVSVVTGAADRSRRSYLALAMTGDLFLTGQACRVIGLLAALVRGVVDPDFVDCVFDENYPHLVPTPEAPIHAMYAREAYYTVQEGKVKAILCPRRCNVYDAGWNDDKTLGQIYDWQTTIREHTVQSWLKSGVDEDGRLVAEKEWTEKVLDPWAVRAREQLADYRRWKTTFKVPGSVIAGEENGATDSPTPATTLPVASLLPPIDSIDSTIPPLFEKVLDYLRKADASGLWPSTTAKRQMVMLSTAAEDGATDNDGNLIEAANLAPTLQAARMRTQTKTQVRSSAYALAEGQGGASGSFSVGAMPGDACNQPKGNTLFPELTKAAFELEIALCPHREPSSMIAINRNAQFRPHTDSGAGAGQSTSLIVGLGTYVGGELVVESETRDIRYKAIEFNGWTERHWTMPFEGERFSLVWFTPKGCEGIRGIDLF
jgi:hypothetical protein